MSETDFTSESRASQLFHQGHYQEALRLYTAIYDRLPRDGDTRIAVGVLLSRSACHLKLKQFEKVLVDCNKVLELDKNNVKAIGRKTKVLCSLGRFIEAHHVAGDWRRKDPHNDQAEKEYKLLEMIIRTLPDQDGDAIIEAPLSASSRRHSEGEEVRLDSSEDFSTVSPMPTTGGERHHAETCTAVSDSIRSLDNEEMHSTSSDTSSSHQSADKNPSPCEEKYCSLDHTVPQSGMRLEPIQKPDTRGAACKHCNVDFESDQACAKHYQTRQHQEIVLAHAKEIWKFRPPPRGLTDKEYSLCSKFTKLGSCPYGSQCYQAHSVDELAEWCERFVLKKRAHEEGTNSECRHAETFLEKLMSTEDPDAVMKENIDSINVHMSSEPKIHLTSKKASHFWMFTLTTRVSLKCVILLDDTNRKYFHISSITVGPKRQQMPQDLEPDCQEWANPNHTMGKSANEHVYRIKVLFTTEIYGTFHQSVIFDFGEEPVLFREICIDCVPTVDVQTLKESLIIQEGRRWDLMKMDIVQFEPIPLPHDEMEEMILRWYPPPFATRFIPLPALLQPSLTQENYRDRMHSMLDLEEMAWFSSIAKFNVKAALQIVDRFMLMPSSHSEAKFARRGELYAYMKLKGNVSEDTAPGRLILQNVNTLYLAPVHGNSNIGSTNDDKCDDGNNTGDDDVDDNKNQQPSKAYEAVIEEKGKNFMFIRLSVQCVSELGLKKDTETTVEIQFHLNRLPICQMHLALDHLFDREFIFPSLSNSTNIPWTPQKLWKDNLDPRLNAKQREAVVAIATDLNIKLPPILIVGPYGTGKTFTIGQATKEVLSQENTRILICTHSNSAADLYIKDYLHPYVENNHPEATPLRVYYRHRWIETVHPTVKQYCLIGSVSQKNGVSGSRSAFRHPTLEDLERIRVVVTTLSMSQYLCLDGVEPGFFTHIFLDEAAQVMECESLLPLRLSGPRTRLVLAGDHMQMGPEVHSEFACERDFHVSLLERLHKTYPNQHPCKIQLCENYRSHQAIIDFTSELFYDSKLVASGNQLQHDIFYPLTFFTARGEEVQHKNSTTFYNNAEVYEIVERVSEIVKSWPKVWGDVDESSIGVVSPYSDQVQRIRSELRKRKLVNVSVERVLNIQGKQFRVILLSTVRTRHSCNTDPNMEEELDYGFLSNAKLLNTAITRAQSMVAAVGDPVSLSTIGKCRKIWERFLEVCNNNGSLYGITWAQLRAELDGVELKKVYVLNPLAPEFIPNRLRHGPVAPPEPVAYGKYGYMFLTRPRPVVAPTGACGRSRWSRTAILRTCLQPSANEVFPVHASCVPKYRVQHPTIANCVPPKSLGTPNRVNIVSPSTSTQMPVSISTEQGHRMPGSHKSFASPDPVSSSLTQSPNEVSAANIQAASLPSNKIQNVIGAPVFMQNLTQSCTGNPVFMQWPTPVSDVGVYPNLAQSQQPMMPVNMRYLAPQFVKQSPVPVQSVPYAGQHVFRMTPRHTYPSYGVQPTQYLCPVMPLHPSYHTLARPVMDPHTPGIQGCHLRYQNHSSPVDNPVAASSVSPLPSPSAPCVTCSSKMSSNSISATSRQTNGLNCDNSRLDAILSGMGTAFFRKLWLSQELYSYITETESEMAAAEFIHKLQEGDFYKDKLKRDALGAKKCSEIDIEDSSIIAISRRSTQNNAKEVATSNCAKGEPSQAESESPLLTKLKRQQKKLNETAYQLTVSQTQQFTGPYSLQKKTTETLPDGKDTTTRLEESRSSTPSWASSGDPLEETCEVADSIIRFLEESHDDQLLSSELSELSSPSISDASPISDHSRPLYLRRSSDTKQNVSAKDSQPLTYASVLQKVPTPKADVPKSELPNSLYPSDPNEKYTSIAPQLPAGNLCRGITTGVPPANPLDILRNLNIKASPSTQALFDYFA